MVKLQENKGTFFVYIPLAKISSLGWRKRDLLDLNLSSDGRSLIINCVEVKQK